jgi:dihydropteroate synthase
VIDRPIIIGIINVTPDSFSDGGNFFSPEEAVVQAQKLVDEGADALDFGGESTRPGANAVDEPEETRRVIPVIERVRELLPDLPISIDTWKASVARAGLEAGADIVNDVSALRFDSKLGPAVAKKKAGLILMHSRGKLAEISSYKHANYSGHVCADVAEELSERASRALALGVRKESIVLDPGIGFSKKSDQSRAILRNLEPLTKLGYPVLVGASRKRTISEAIRESRGLGEDVEISIGARDYGTAGANVMALCSGAMLFRVHNVAVNRAALDVAWQVLRSGR